MDESVIKELTMFLRDPKLDVRRIALQNIMALSRSGEAVAIFEGVAKDMSKDLWHIALNDHPLAAHSAISILINLTSAPNSPFLQEIREHAEWTRGLAKEINQEGFVLADLAAMLLSNLTKHPEIAKQLQEDDVKALIETFVKGEGKKWNSTADYDFLANVFANVASTSTGRSMLFDALASDGAPLLSSLLPFLEHDSLVRRGGVLSTLKNCAFQIPKHDVLIDEDGMNLLPRIMLPLAGPEELSEEDMDGMPDELQLLEPDKKREPDSSLRLILVEILLLLGTTRFGRDLMRQRKVYPIIREAHLAENDEHIQETMERLVNLIAREEGEEETEEDFPEIEPLM